MTGKEIAEAVNEIIKSLDKEKFNEAINWGDLHCVEVVECKEIWPEENKPYTTVYIEEAAPECYEFAIEISNRFEKQYGLEICVKTEW